MTGGQVHLNLHVKVSPRWFKNNYVLEELGLPRAHNSARVWRAKK
jgi:GTP-binding protein Era